MQASNSFLVTGLSTNQENLPKEGESQKMVVNYLSVSSITIFKTQTYNEAFSVVGGSVTFRR